MSHCFLEPARFEEVRFAGSWAFARVGDGYVGVWSQHGYHLGESGQYAGGELVCEAAENTWIAEGGRAADWGTFDAFSQALSASAPRSEQGRVIYASPSLGRFITGWDAAPTVNGEALELHDYPLVDSPWAHSDFGSGILKITYGGQTHQCYFLG